MAKWLNKKIVILSLLAIVSLFFFSYDTQANMQGDYSKSVGDQLTANEWNLLVQDFVMKASTTPQRLYGAYGIGRDPGTGFALDVIGDTRSDYFTGDLSASYVSSGVFGSNIDGGEGAVYSFPGDVGIGAVLPDHRLVVTGETNVGINIFSSNNSDHPYIHLSGDSGNTNSEGLRIWYHDSAPNTYFDSMFNNDSYGFRFRTKVSGTPVNALTILGNGKVGINRIDPSYALDVNGQVRHSNTLTQSGNILMSGYIGRGASNARISFSSSNIVSIEDSKVGIGTTSPSAPLSVASLLTGDYINVGGGHIGGLDLVPTADDHAVPLIYLKDNYISTTTISDSTHWKLSGNNLYASSTDWNIGIGTNNPSSVLTIGNNRWISSINGAGDSSVNMFRVNTNNQIEVGAPLLIGTFEFAPNSGLVSFVDMPITSDSPNNEAHGYVFKLDRENVLGVYGESDGSGGVKNKRVGIGTAFPTSLLTLSGGDLEIDHNKSIIVNDNATNTTLLIGNYADGEEFVYGAGTSSNLFTSSLAVEGDVKAHRLCIEEDCKGAWGELVSAGMPSGSAGQLLVNSGGTNWSATSSLFIASNGNVGIGTSNPTEKLTFDILAPLRGGIAWKDNSLDSHGMKILYDESSNTLNIVDRVSSVDTDMVTFKRGGNIGIGTTTPNTAKLVVNAGTGEAIDVLNGRITGLAEPAALTDAVNKEYVDNNISVAVSSRWILNDINLFASSTTWRIGIGTTTPAAQLQVNANDSTEGIRVISSNFSPLVARNTADTADLFRVNQEGKLKIASSIQIGDDSDVCNPSNAGKIKYVATSTQSYICDGTRWLNQKNCGTVTDFEGNTYGTVVIGGQCWMAENYRYLPEITPEGDWGSTTAPQYAVYDYTGTSVAEAKATANYQEHGALYNWPAVMNSSNVAGAQGICPPGWHVPTDHEWNILEKTVVGIINSSNLQYPCSLSETGWQRCADNTGDNEGANGVGQALKELGLGSSVGQGTDLVGFSSKLSGGRSTNASFVNLSSDAYFWSSTPSSDTFAWLRLLRSSFSTVLRGANLKGLGFSLRCLKD